MVPTLEKVLENYHKKKAIITMVKIVRLVLCQQPIPILGTKFLIVPTTF